MTSCSPLRPFSPSLNTEKKKTGQSKLHQEGLKIWFGQAALLRKSKGPTRTHAEATTPQNQSVLSLRICGQTGLAFQDSILQVQTQSFRIL